MRTLFTALAASAGFVFASSAENLNGASASVTSSEYRLGGAEIILAQQQYTPRSVLRQQAQQPGFQGDQARPLQRAVPVELERVPFAVRNTILSQIHPAQIEDVVRGFAEGLPVYQVSFRDRDGELHGFRVDEDGRFITRLSGHELRQAEGLRPEGFRQVPRAEGFRPDPAAERFRTDPRAEGFRPDPRFHGGPEARQWGGFALPLSEGQHVELRQVPQPVQERIREHARGARIENINRGELLGLTAYQAAFKVNGAHHELRLAEDGYFLEESADGQVIRQSPLVQNRLAFLRDLPRPVQRSIQEQAGGALIRNIEQDRRDGQLVYHVALDLRGRPAQTVVAQDGQVLQQSGLVRAVGAPPPAVGAPPQFGQDHPITRKVTFEQLPPAVQQTVRSQVNVDDIEDIDERTEHGRTTYEVGFKRNGQHVELLVNSDGRVLSRQEVN
jgi:uncharacterized membrane protein YkoI